MIEHPLLLELKDFLGPQGVVAADVAASRQAHGMEQCAFEGRLIVRPANTGQVVEVLRLCHRRGHAVVTHGGLTGLTRGTMASPADVILSTERMTSVLEVSPTQRIAVVEAGVPLASVQDAAEAHNLFFPLDLGARGTATIGGCIATNAGGNRVIRYGMMRDSVLGLEAVLADGTVVSTMNRLIKNNTGYDVKHLFVGSEGTLGVITRAVLRLREKPSSRCMAVVALSHFGQAGALLKHMDAQLAGSLSAFELMWSSFYDLVTTPPAVTRPPLPQGSPFYALVEALGSSPEADQARFEAVLASALEKGLLVDASIASSQKQCDDLWHMRDDVHQFYRLGKVWAYDVSLALDDISDYVEKVRATAAQMLPSVALWAYGHLGDNNLHIVFTGGEAANHQVLDEIVYAPLMKYGGSISGEHGIGLDKKDWLSVSRSPAELALMRTMKKALDPGNRLNPQVLF